MSANTKIEWTERTWNPVRGCSRISEGCRNCYAERMAARMHKPGQWGHGLTANGRWNGEVRLVKEKLLEPLRWREPRLCFVNSTSDLFHEKLSAAAIVDVFAVMYLARQHTFQVLTKRADILRAVVGGAIFRSEVMERAQDLAFDCDTIPSYPLIAVDQADWPLRNVWLGVSVEDQKTADERIPLLLQTPAAVRFISAEPLLGAVDLGDIVIRERAGESHIDSLYCDVGPEDDEFEGHTLDWVIAGGESGAGARPMHPDWVRSICDQCDDAEVPFFFKQWGEWAPLSALPEEIRLEMSLKPGVVLNADGSEWDSLVDPVDDTTVVYRAGKKDAGAILDGREWREMPQ